MEELDVNTTCEVLNEILEYELAGVVRYTHYGLMVTGPYRQPIVDFMKAQAAESLTHAEQAGEIITGLGGHPSQKIAEIEESHRHDIRQILEESLAHEESAVGLYRKLFVKPEAPPRRRSWFDFSSPPPPPRRRRWMEPLRRRLNPPPTPPPRRRSVAPLFPARALRGAKN